MWVRRRVTTRIAVAGALAVVVVVGVMVVAWLWPVDRSSGVPVDEAVRDFRLSTVPGVVGPGVAPTTTSVPDTTAAAGSPTNAASLASTSSPPTTGTVPGHEAAVPSTLELPETGVYRYTTTGWEDVDALQGARHDYPDETTITVTDDGCGVHLRWDALRERREEWQLCATAAGIELQPTAVQYHEFFQRAELERVVCDQSVVVVPAGELPDPVVLSCDREGDPWVVTWTVVGRATRTVADAEVPVWHVRMNVVDDDEFWEHTSVQWFLDDRGLPVEVTSTKESNSPSQIGDVTYREDYELDLAALEPLQ